MSKSLKLWLFSQYILVGLLILLIGIGTVPSYLSGRWIWQEVPDILNIKHLKNLSETGLTLPDAQLKEHQPFMLGNKKWSAQVFQKSEQPFMLLLMPQDYHKNLPQTELSDLQYLEKWKIDSERSIRVPIQINQERYSVVPRYFKAWTKTTFIIVQWYAWPGGGSYSASNWFWQDQWSQLRQKRLPWIAVTLKIPIEPSQELKTMLPTINSLVQTVQTNLETQVFSQLQTSSTSVK